jgi:predicted aspartyl protease
MVPGPPIQAFLTTIKAGEPWVLLTIEKHKVSLLIDTGASISAIPFSPRKLLFEAYQSSL